MKLELQICHVTITPIDYYYSYVGITKAKTELRVTLKEKLAY